VSHRTLAFFYAGRQVSRTPNRAAWRKPATQKIGARYARTRWFRAAWRIRSAVKDTSPLIEERAIFIAEYAGRQQSGFFSLFPISTLWRRRVRLGRRMNEPRNVRKTVSRWSEGQL